MVEKKAYQCGTCSTEFSRYPSQVKTDVPYCSGSCWHTSRRKPKAVATPRELLPNRYFSAHAPNHPLATEGGRVGPHRIVLYDAIGPGPHPCHWCGESVAWAVRRATRRGDLVVDHVDGNRRNNKLANLVPSCHGCNVNRSRTDLIADEDLHIPRRGGGRYRAVEKNCERCGRGFLTQVYEKRPNRGRFCSRSCARSRPK